MTREQIGKVIEFCRANFPNDGAEGESVHKLCEYIGQLQAEMDRLTADHVRRVLLDGVKLAQLTKERDQARRLVQYFAPNEPAARGWKMADETGV